MDKTPFYFDKETPIHLTNVQFMSHKIGDFMSYGWIQGCSDLNNLIHKIPNIDENFKDCEFTFNEITNHIEHRLKSIDGLLSMVWLSNFFRLGAVFHLNASENSIISITPDNYTHYCINKILTGIEITADDKVNLEPGVESSLNKIVATACFNVASILREGIGVEKDLATAIEYYNKAASLGDANASYILGVLSHQNGDLYHGHTHFLRAANFGHIDSQINVAANYFYGEIVSQDKELAYYWAKIASYQDDAEGRKLSSIIEKSLSKIQIEYLDAAILNFSDK